MPKFYRQNRKRIDPRYFLNETTNRDLDESSISPEQKRINAETLYPMLKKLVSRKDLDPRVKSGINDLFSKTINTIRREGEPLSDEQLKTLVAAATDFSSLSAFPSKVIAMVSQAQGTMKGDIDGDRDVDPQDVADLAQQVAQSSGTSKEQLMVMISDRISDVGFGKETEEDFDYTKEELCDDDSNLCGDIMGITYEEYQAFKNSSIQKSDRENYNLASSVMQNDDNISLSKKIPSGLG